MLPPSQTSWLISQPETALSASAVFEDQLCLRYLAPGPNLASNLDFSVLRRDLTRNLNRTQADVLDEVAAAVDDEFGGEDGEEEWREVGFSKALLAVATRGANRIFVGRSLCRDAGFLKLMSWYATAFGTCTLVMRLLVPKFLWPVFGPVVGVPVTLVRWWLSRRVVKLARERMAAGVKGQDMLQWTLDAGVQKDDPQEQDLWNVVGKVLMLNFFGKSTPPSYLSSGLTSGTAVHTVSLTTTSALLDLLCNPSATELIATLRAEAEAILPKALEDPTAIREMVKLDSFFRESLRFKPMSEHGLSRDVMQEGGIATPDGTHLPRGARVCLAVGPTMRDGAFMEGASLYEPLRFVPASAAEENATEDVEVTKPKGVSMRNALVNIDEHFLPFGLGKHACPGRFFAAQELKLLFAYILVHYDLQPLETRPKEIEFGDVSLPSQKARIKVRRRAQPAEGHDSAAPESATGSEEIDRQKVGSAG